MSNWSRRPLSADQLMYAACDAYVQILIHDKARDTGIQIKLSEIEG